MTLKKQYIFIVTAILFSVIVGVSLLLIIVFPRSSPSNGGGDSGDSGDTGYKGICMFDIDGTLTNQGLDANQNGELFQICLDAGYAIGINTAGPVYTPDKVPSWPPTSKYFYWMPKNLYDFLVKNNWNTFNNVGSYYLNGKVNKQAYDNNKAPSGISQNGFNKGLALKETAALYNVKDPNCVIMFDDDRNFIQGMREFNSSYNINCINADRQPPCTGMTKEAVIQALNKCKNNTK